ncbi:uncharacterized protein LOC111709168 [Eurytemora carolleeae]|uniref:uncharacterized protein LOC111709168 n=1 Tax=Eurytemora carolleeae TaxID=1294199 RepID=UPI000C7907F4|nr:uncharacterized protein LOC111709168 [Eurytemora carolleeae]|eukprot:XP_023338544.1 uncharacterized protein LOC111709168 [Eurytemora affinis]
MVSKPYYSQLIKLKMTWRSLPLNVSGDVFPCCGSRYQQLRLVNNKACTARPYAIIRPRTTEDVALAVNFAHRHRIQISVRSGGHGYTCNQIKEGAILIDLRGLNKISLIKTGKSRTGLAAVLGTGSTWGDVQRKIPLDRYSYPHGQCRSVGVGGYLLGGGVNWLGTFNKYGYGAEQILQMRVVTANGTILDLHPGYTVKYPKYPHEPIQTIQNQYENDLFFAMRGAGSSYAIATEFLYTIHPTPETNPAVLLVWVTDKTDLWKLQAAATGSSKYSVSVNNEFAGDFWNNFKTRIVYKFLPTILTSLKIIHRSGDLPLFLTITDIRPYAGEFTDPVEAARFLEKYGVNLVYTNPVIVKAFDSFARYLYEMNIKEQEVQPAGEYHLAGVHLGGMADTTALEEVFFRNPTFGIKRTNNQMFRELGCDYCFWVIHFRNRQSFPSVEYPISTNTDNNLVHGVDSNLVCLFRNRNSECPREVIRVKKTMEKRLDHYNLSYSKYYNFPSCDSEDWMWKYWGQNYYQLLAIKSFWDPENIFHSCQSVGSTDNSCCPFTLNKPNGRGRP